MPDALFSGSRIWGQMQLTILSAEILNFDSKRPLASAVISLKEGDFQDILQLLKTSPPRSASIFLYTEIYNEDAIISRSMSGEASTVDIYDLSWRYPLI